MSLAKLAGCSVQRAELAWRRSLAAQTIAGIKAEAQHNAAGVARRE